MLARVGLLEALFFPVAMAALIGPARFGMIVAYAAGLTIGDQ